MRMQICIVILYYKKGQNQNKVESAIKYRVTDINKFKKFIYEQKCTTKDIHTKVIRVER